MAPAKCKKGRFGDTDGVDHISKIHRELEHLEEKKSVLEEKMQKLLKNISQMCPKVIDAENEVEKALHDKMAKECQLRMKCEITRLCEDQKRTERILCKYDEQLKQKYKQYKKCSSGAKCDNF